MSFDKQNFARTIQEQQAGISPQMWPIKLDPGTGANRVSLNSPFEVDINPCDCIWLPVTFDKSYGVHPIQTDPLSGGWFPSPSVAGANVWEMWDSTQPSMQFNFAPPIFGLRFNTPNNPWMLWGLGESCINSGSPLFGWGNTTPGSGVTPRALARWGASSMMRSITGPISRLWCQ